MTERAVVISPHRGVEQSARERMATMLPLLRLWVRRELRVRYRQSVLRGGWSLFQPLALLVTYGWVLTAVFGIQETEVPYLTFAWAGIVPFTFAAQSLSLGVGAIQQAGPLISRMAFPREVLPLSVVGCAGVDLAVMGGLLLAVSWVQVGAPTVHLIGVVLPLAVLVTWTAGLTLAASAVTVYRRDLNHAMPLLLRVAFIVTPVMYPAVLLEDQVAGATRVNPLAVVIEGVRDAVFRGRWPDVPLLGVHLVLGIVVLVAGFWLFRRLEPGMSDYA